MTKQYPALKDLALWSHQERAVEMVTSYINNYRQAHTQSSALVQMPTGSGKSGVIAVLARCTENVGLTVILTPRKSLREQLYRDIKGRFFEHIGYPVDQLPKVVEEVAEGSDLRLETPASGQVLVMTIQMLVTLAADPSRAGLFARLANETSLLIVDEGHYEPAFEWSKTIRKIQAPKVIFTATPYRNDLKVFDVAHDYSFVLSLKAATRDRYLRSVKMVPRSHTMNPAAFVEDVVKFYDETFPTQSNDPPRVIIRCDDRASIRHLAHELQKRGKSVVGIHDTFKNDEPWERKEVPEPKNEPAVFWIHQFKLLEGIDDPRFQVVALFQKIRNGRALVQQVGRIIRNPKRLDGATGYVLDHWSGYHSELWDGFLSYDAMIAKYGSAVFELSTGNGMVDRLIESQPRIAYLEGRFRAKLDLDQIEPHRDIQVPLRANLIEKEPTFNIDVAAAFLVESYQDADRVVHLYSPSQETRVILSIRCSNSPYLRRHSFMEADLHVTVLHEFPQYVSLFDSSGPSLMGEAKLGLGQSLDSKLLKKLFHPSGNGRLTSVSLNNSNLGTSSVRSRTITASSIDATVPGFNDYAHICTTAEGYSDDVAGSVQGAGLARRYVGFSRGRVTQSGGGHVPLPEYLQWLARLGTLLVSNASTLPVLDRYALEVNVPLQADPRSILLDLEEAKESYIPLDSPEDPMIIEDACCDVTNGAFKIMANGRQVHAHVKLIKGRYQIESAQLDEMYVPKEGDTLPGSLVKYLNSTQSFRILPEDLTRVYVRGQFYSPAMKIGSQFDRHTYSLGNCFVTDSKIGRCDSEKGKAGYYRNHNDDWDPTSLFGIISRCGLGTGVAHHFGDPDIIVCDDVGSEIADFVLCDLKQPRVVFIHAKASSNTRLCSASALHEVCAQAVKNLGYLAMFNDHQPSKLSSWDKEWKGKIGKKSIGTVAKRIHKGNGGGTHIWSQLRAAINNPHVDKEVWLFTGNTVSRKHFETELASPSPPANVVQAAYLLHATMSDVAAVGAKLKVFCAE